MVLPLEGVDEREASSGWTFDRETLAASKAANSSCAAVVMLGRCNHRQSCSVREYQSARNRGCSLCKIMTGGCREGCRGDRPKTYVRYLSDERGAKMIFGYVHGWCMYRRWAAVHEVATYTVSVRGEKRGKEAVEKSTAT